MSVVFAMRYQAVLFDCDGVLVDSEPLTMQVLRDMLEELGWRLTLHECMQIFVGKATRDEAALIAQKTGQSFSTEWLHTFWARRDVALRAHLQPVEGALALVRQAHAYTGGQIACVSGADRDKLALQLGKTGLLPWFEGRVFSGHDMPRSKPHPDVYLAAMQALQVSPQGCLVVEDTPTGVQAGVAAGACVIGYRAEDSPAVTPAMLLQAGAAAVVRRLDEVPRYWTGVHTP